MNHLGIYRTRIYSRHAWTPALCAVTLVVASVVRPKDRNGQVHHETWLCSFDAEFRLARGISASCGMGQLAHACCLGVAAGSYLETLPDPATNNSLTFPLPLLHTL